MSVTAIAPASTAELGGQHEHARPLRPVFAGDLVGPAVAASDLRGGLLQVAETLRKTRGASGVEWWTPTADASSCRRDLAIGGTTGPRTAYPLGPAGTLVVIGTQAAGIEQAIAPLRPWAHHRWNEERLTEHALRLAQRNQTLEEAAALIAHDVKSALTFALRSGRFRDGLEQGLDIVDSIIDAVCSPGSDGRAARVEETVRDAVSDLGDGRTEVLTNVTDRFPMPSQALRVVLRNLLANAIAARARRIQISVVTRNGRATLVVDDDGHGLDSEGGYCTGSQLGLNLCRRLVACFGGRIDLESLPAGGTRALLEVTGAVG
ncbi:ATP-binding protein [Jatrophihabitans sp. DSM 45814]